MFDAVVARKARMGMVIDGLGKQPREDLVTSALFGAIRFLTPKGQVKAINALLGIDSPFVQEVSNPIEIYLWPYLRGKGENSEPDVVIRFSDGSYWIVEVKWGAGLGEDQIGREIRTVQRGECRRGGLPEGSRNVVGYTLLGALEKHGPAMDGARRMWEQCLSLSALPWTAVTEKLRELARNASDDSGLVAWSRLAAAFLGGEPEGKALGEWPVLQMPQSFTFSFNADASFPPVSGLTWVSECRFNFNENE
ncbi:hypothetical protein [Thalassococcus profundi]|uniref:hypothetical protein n=1 Tax=Thalassococcus profundi TaxID=2282382 RepID=UPI004058B2A9